MPTNDDIEGMLIQLDLPFDSIGQGLWLVHDEADLIDNIVLYHDSPLLTIRVKVMDLPADNREALFARLLTLNVTDVVHGAYGIESDAVVLVDTIQSPSLDLNELQGSLDSIILALTTHYAELSKFQPKRSSDEAA
jgi:hypothetical protein